MAEDTKALLVTSLWLWILSHCSSVRTGRTGHFPPELGGSLSSLLGTPQPGLMLASLTGITRAFTTQLRTLT